MERWRAIALCVHGRDLCFGSYPATTCRVLTSEADIGTYTFNKHVIKHRFCQTCGIHPYGEGTDPKGNRMGAINIRCLDGIDLETVPVQHFDGRSL